MSFVYMRNLIINREPGGKEIFPHIQLNAETGVCLISGSSYMQNPILFFQPVINWFQEYINENRGRLVVYYDLKSLNTGTSRVIYQILEILREYKRNGGDVNIKWYVEDDQDFHTDDIIDMSLQFEIDIEVLVS
jgi:hypothetical protein